MYYHQQACSVFMSVIQFQVNKFCEESLQIILKQLLLICLLTVIIKVYSCNIDF